jgi:hypothetical protein
MRDQRKNPRFARTEAWATRPNIYSSPKPEPSAPKDWPWSSFSFYSKLKHGLLRVDSLN